VPLPTANRPGLAALSYRVGTHATFLETMKARVSGRDYPQLVGLTSRAPDDAAIALLDAWATVADVLTFYQERVANEGYLRTATERRSVVELARLVGYRPRPGVASSVYLSYTIDEKFTEEVLIPAGSRAQSVPGPGEIAQSFETSEDLKARSAWNDLHPRMSRPQTATSIRCGDGEWAHVYLKGTATNLKANDPLLIGFAGGRPGFVRVRAVAPDAVTDRTRVTLQLRAVCASTTKASTPPRLRLIDSLTAPPSVPPASARRLERRLDEQFSSGPLAVEGPALLRTLSANDASYGAAKALAPSLRETLTSAAANAEVAPLPRITVFALRVKAPVFGHNAPKRMRVLDGEISVIGDWPIIEGPPIILAPEAVAQASRIEHEQGHTIHLDGKHEAILPESWLVVETPNTRLTEARQLIVRARRVDAMASRAEYGMSGPATAIEICEPGDCTTPWIDVTKPPTQLTDDDFEAIRRTAVYAQSEELELAEEPILQPVCGGSTDLIELDDFYEDLEAGRWVVVSGEREIAGTSGVRFSELSMLSSVTQGVRTVQDPEDDDGKPVPLPGDATHTFIKLDQELAYCFKRDTVRIHGNVVLATHGETRRETLGNGEGSRPLQQFALKQSPLTHVPADNPSGVESTLGVYVNDVRWHEAETLAGLGPTDRQFSTQTADDGTTKVVFGNGREGARLPTGIENVRAVYRSGIGAGGNVKAGQISLLSTRPLGAKEVVNPLPASGGADRETRDQARKNAPLAVMALDRLVSVQDYEDFARVFGGVGKARAAELSDGRRQLVHVTIAGRDDIPIEPHSALYRNLTQALRRFGDPDQAFRLDVRELLLLVMSARVRVHADYLWDKVEPRVRAALLDAFGFDRRELGEDALLSVAISTMQSVTGVEWVDVDAFGGVPERVPDLDGRRRLEPGEIAEAVRQIVIRDTSRGPAPRVRVNHAGRENGNLRPAQIAYLSPLVPATLILNEVPR